MVAAKERVGTTMTTHPPVDWLFTGEQDPKTLGPDWMPIDASAIDGVVAKEIRAVPASNGCLTEIWRHEWPGHDVTMNQVFMRTLEPGTVSGWHAHTRTTDRFFCAAGSVRLSLFDGRRASPTVGKVWHRLLNEKRPVLIAVPAGVWHGVKSVGSIPALILNLVDHAYSYDSPDHWRLPPDTVKIPYALR
jgi:dTDP-4-dehydrorhamnose 3,5-epimerase